MQKDTKHYTILIVEDNPGDRLLVEDYLDETMAAPTLLFGESYKKASKVLQDYDSKIDLLLLDLSLPDLQGEELARKMLEQAGQTPIIILTGYTNLNFAAKSLSMGISDYLLKENLSPTVLHKSIVYNIERHNYLLQIKESEHRYSELFHLSPQPMWVYSVETLKFLDVNQSAIKHYGYSYDEFLEMTIKDIRPTSQIPKLEETLAYNRKSEKTSFQGEFIHKTKSGDEIVVDIYSNSINFKGAKASVILANDITERYRHILAIEKQNEKLRKIAWTQSHVVRAPLARIMGLIALINSDIPTSEENKGLLDNIAMSANELDQVIREIIQTTQNSHNQKLIS